MTDTETLTEDRPQERAPTWADLQHFEALMKAERNWTRGDCCKALGVSPGKWRRMEASGEVDLTTALAAAAVEKGLGPYRAPPI